MGLHRAAFKVGTPLDGERSVMNIANNMRVRLENHVCGLYGTLDSPVHNHPLGCDSSGNMGFTRKNKRSAVQFAIHLPIDLN